MTPLGKFTNKIQNVTNAQKNYESHPNFANKNLSQCTQYLRRFHNPCDGDIFARYVLQNRHKKVQHSFIKKKLNLKGQAKEKIRK
jgi:hypothetical protein